MSEKVSEQRQRKPRAKRSPRVDTGKKIVVRVSPDEFAHLQREAGDVGVSAYVRASLFGGGVRSRDVLRVIATLHIAGLNVKRMVDDDMPPAAAEATLKEVRAAIVRLGRLLPGADAP